MRTRNRELNDFLYGGPLPEGCPTGIEKQLARRLQMLKAANSLLDLRAPPGNRLEALTGNLRGYWSIRVNKQYRLVFRWDEMTQEVYDVYFTDYHRG